MFATSQNGKSETHLSECCFRLFGIPKSIATPPKVTKPKKTKREREINILDYYIHKCIDVYILIND